jgi:MFS transporter, NNP family, nitrate/nitrite transporter
VNFMAQAAAKRSIAPKWRAWSGLLSLPGLAFALAFAFAFAFGAASTFKSIGHEFPHNVGVLSGTVAPAGSGRLPVAESVWTTGRPAAIRPSAFMPLHGVAWASAIWIYLTEVRRKDVMSNTSSNGPVVRGTDFHQAGTQS